jgi:subtilisin family serine protease
MKGPDVSQTSASPLVRRLLPVLVVTALCGAPAFPFGPGSAEARPRLDPRLQSLRLRLTEEKAAGRTPRMLAATSTTLFPEVRVLESGSRPTLGIDCLVKVQSGGFQALEQRGITTRSRSGGFATITLTPEQLETVAGLDLVDQVEMTRELKPYLDVSAPLVHAPEVQGGDAPNFSATGFTGRNVVIGIIDTGLDINNDDFKKPNGKTRVKYVWDQLNGTGPRPIEFGIGTEWTEDQINSGAAVVLDTNGHGTHVGGIAVGDGSSTGNGQPAYKYVGIAPEADVILVKTNFQTDDVIDAITYVFSRAGAKDAVVNLSLGTQDGPHDGTSLFDQMISNQLGPGRIITAAAGNEASSTAPIHARLSMSPGVDSLVFTFQVPSYSPSAGSQNDYIFLDGWYEGTDNFSFVIQSPGGWRTREIPNNNRLVACSDRLGGEGRLLVDNNNITDLPAPPNGDKEFYLEITDYSISGSGACGNPAPGLWKIIAYRRGTVVGPGNMDLWVTLSELGGSRLNYPWFVSGASNTHLVGSPASAPGVLSAGAYISKRMWTTLRAGARQYDNVTDSDIGRIASFSSPGPLRTGEIAPDLAAPGMGIASTLSASSPVDDRFLLPDGKHVINQGTSQAAPHVAGAAALLLERCPHLTPAELFERFTATADHDAFTGAQANNVYGYGKLNVLNALNYQTDALVCGIDGEGAPDLGSTLSYSDPTPGSRNRRWSVVSVPGGIASIVGSATAATVQVHFTGYGTSELVLSVSDPGAAEECFTRCKKDLVIGLGLFSVLEAVSEPGQVRVRWHLVEAVSTIEGFHVRRADSENGTYTRITPALLTGSGLDFEFVDTAVSPGRDYWYQVEVLFTGGETQLFGPLLGSAIPIQLFLAQNGPNPFADETTILYSLPGTDAARIDVFDLGGRLVRTLLDSPASAAGEGEVRWDGRDQSGQPSPNGIYFYQLSAGSRRQTKKMMLLRR